MGARVEIGRERLSIKGGRVVDPANGVDAIVDVHVADGEIVAVGDASNDFRSDRDIDARGKIVCPGLVDLRAALREPGAEHKATIASETRAAAAGGVTTLCCPPDTSPPIDSTAVAKLVQTRAAQAGYARVLPLGALTCQLDGRRISEMAALKESGCVGVSNAYRPLENTLVTRRAMEYAATYGLTVFINAEDHWLRDNGCVHEGTVSTRLGLPGIPEAAETAAVACYLALIKQTGVRAHFCCLSTALGAGMVARAKYDGLPVSADVSAHQLHLTEYDADQFNSLCHVRPPLRTQRDRDGLRGELARSALAAICSDHQPHEADAKLAPFAETAHGVSALDTLLPLSLKLVEEGLMTTAEVVARLTHQPAAILGVDAGTLSVGAAADICIFDPEHYWLVSEESLVSRGHNTPFLGWELKGRAICTVLAGRVVHCVP
ncbi:MAG: dihydroorotase [Gammaproteobacteria bacterium]|nr:dihydroorotase [Gammaproteobacteria bacterium]